jgi:hypothetical protein
MEGIGADKRPRALPLLWDANRLHQLWSGYDDVVLSTWYPVVDSDPGGGMETVAWWWEMVACCMDGAEASMIRSSWKLHAIRRRPSLALLTTSMTGRCEHHALPYRTCDTKHSTEPVQLRVIMVLCIASSAGLRCIRIRLSTGIRDGPDGSRTGVCGGSRNYHAQASVADREWGKAFSSTAFGVRSTLGILVEPGKGELRKLVDSIQSVLLFCDRGRVLAPQLGWTHEARQTCDGNGRPVTMVRTGGARG